MIGLEEIASALLGAAPELGVVVLVVLLLVLFIRAASHDRVDYRESLKAAADRHKDEVTRINSDHDAELAELREDIKALRLQVDELNLTIDIERKARREAEDVAAQAKRRADDAESRYLGPTGQARPSGSHRREGGVL